MEVETKVELRIGFKVCGRVYARRECVIEVKIPTRCIIAANCMMLIFF